MILVGIVPGIGRRGMRKRSGWGEFKCDIFDTL
jgi:hypothetical protein